MHLFDLPSTDLFSKTSADMARGALKGLKRTRPSPGEKVVVKGQPSQGAGDRNSQGVTCESVWGTGRMFSSLIANSRT